MPSILKTSKRLDCHQSRCNKHQCFSYHYCNLVSFAFENLISPKTSNSWNWRPWLEVHLRYLITCVVVFQCISVGAWRNWHNLLIENAISSMIIEQYWKAPWMLHIGVGSTRGEPWYFYYLEPNTIGVLSNLEESKPTFVRSRLTYFCW